MLRSKSEENLSNMQPTTPLRSRSADFARTNANDIQVNITNAVMDAVNTEMETDIASTTTTTMTTGRSNEITHMMLPPKEGLGLSSEILMQLRDLIVSDVEGPFRQIHYIVVTSDSKKYINIAKIKIKIIALIISFFLCFLANSIII